MYRASLFCHHRTLHMNTGTHLVAMCSPADTRIRASKFLQRHRQVSLGLRYSSPKQGSGNILLLLLFWASFSHGKNIYRKEPAPVQWSPPGSHEGGSAGPGKCSHKSLNLKQQLTEQTRDSMSSNTWRDRFQGLLTPGRLQNAAEALGARSRNRRCGIAGFSFEVAARVLFIEFLVGLLGNRKPQVRGPVEVG